MALYEWEEVPPGSGTWRRTDVLKHPGESPCLRGCDDLPDCEHSCRAYESWTEDVEAWKRQQERSE